MTNAATTDPGTGFAELRGHLLHGVRTGENASRAALGTDVWTYRERNPEENEIFNAAMAALSWAGAAQEVARVRFQPPSHHRRHRG